MKIVLGCKKWSWNHQRGFRIYAPDIRSLGSVLQYPSSDGKWDSFATFREQVITGNHPAAYARSVDIYDGNKSIMATVTFASHGRTFQGYITAPVNSWLLEYVTKRMGTDLKCEYIVHPGQDFIFIPAMANSVYDELDKKDNIGKKKVHKLLKKNHYFNPGLNTLEIGLYFELIEYERLKTEFPPQSHKVIHRYPSIDSSFTVLKQNNVSCDIDVGTASGDIVKCVEVKSISLDEEKPFNLTIREWKSRIWCREHKIPYEIIIYYHFRYQITKRIAIGASSKLKHIPSGYFCYLSDS